MSGEAAQRNMIERVQQVLIEELMPLLGVQDGGVQVVAVEEGVAQLRLEGSCTSCVGSLHGLLGAVEKTVRQRVPEVRWLELVL